jgi:hypothetical protein
MLKTIHILLPVSTCLNLSDNGFTVLTMADLEYYEVSNALKIKDKTLPATSLFSVSHGNGDIDNREDNENNSKDDLSS